MKAIWNKFWEVIGTIFLVCGVVYAFEKVTIAQSILIIGGFALFGASVIVRVPKTTTKYIYDAQGNFVGSEITTD